MFHFNSIQNSCNYLTRHPTHYKIPTVFNVNIDIDFIVILSYLLLNPPCFNIINYVFDNINCVSFKFLESTIF